MNAYPFSCSIFYVLLAAPVVAGQTPDLAKLDQMLAKAAAVARAHLKKSDFEAGYKVCAQELHATRVALEGRPELRIVIDVGLRQAGKKPLRAGAEDLTSVIDVLRRHLKPEERKPSDAELIRLAALREQALMFHKKAQWREAVDAWRDVIAAGVPCHGSESYQLALDLNQLHNAHYNLDEIDEAAALVARCADIVKRGPPEKHGAVPMLLDRVGVLYQRLTRLERAVEVLEESLTWRAKLGQSPASTQKRLGVVLLELGRSEDARQMLDVALAEFRKAKAPKLNEWKEQIECANDLGKVLAMMADYAQAQARMREAQSLCMTHFDKHVMLLAQCDQYQAELHRYRGEFAEALRIYQGLLKTYEKEPLHLANAMVAFADLHTLTDQYKAAEAFYVRAIKLRKDTLGPDHPEVALALSSLGLMYMNQQEHQKAEPLLREALRIRQEKYGHGNPAVSNSLSQLAALYAETNRPKQALDLYKQACENQKKSFGEKHPEYALALNNLAAFLEAQGELDKAKDVSAQALRSVQMIPGNFPLANEHLRVHPTTVLILGNHAALLQQSLVKKPNREDGRASEHFSRLALDILIRIRRENLVSLDSKTWMTNARFDLFPQRVETLRHLAALEGGSEHLEAAFRTAELGAARTFVESLGSSRASNFGRISPELQAEESAALKAIQKLDLEIDREAVAQNDLKRLLQLIEERRAAEERVRKVLAQAEPGYAAFKYPKPCEIKEARDALQADEIALLFVPGTKKSFVVLMDANPRPDDPSAGLAIVELARQDVLAEIVAALIDDETIRLPTSVFKARSREAFDTILGPVMNRIKNKHLVIVPNGQLCFLPFELLVEPDGKYLVEKHRVRYAPSLTALHFINLWKKERAAPAMPLFAVGDPIYGHGYERIVHAGYEVAAISKLLKAKDEFVLTRAKASKAEIKKLSDADAIAKAKYVHFATHGVLGLDRGKQPALVLSQSDVKGKDAEDESLLQMDEITRLKLNADLVVLSACKSGQGRLHQGEGVTGIARAFLFAGSKGVVCSLWAVDDRETANLMIDFYGHLEKGKSAPEALREAQLAMIRAGKAPLYWAPFIVIGE